MIEFLTIPPSAILAIGGLFVGLIGLIVGTIKAMPFELSLFICGLGAVAFLGGCLLNRAGIW